MLLAILFLSAMQTETDAQPIRKIVCYNGTVVVLGENCPAPLPPPPIPYSASTVRGPFNALRPKGNPGSWVTSDDYPTTALIAEKSGTVEFKLVVNKWGSVADCQITSSSGNADLDEATCEKVAVRAKFYPATDKDAKPISATYNNRVRWVVPMDAPDIPMQQNANPYLQVEAIRTKEPQPFPESGFLEIEYIVRVDGSFGQCTETGDLFQKIGEKETMCSQAKTNMQKLEPYFDASGKPIEKKVKVSMTVEINDIK